MEPFKNGAAFVNTEIAFPPLPFPAIIESNPPTSSEECSSLNTQEISLEQKEISFLPDNRKTKGLTKLKREAFKSSHPSNLLTLFVKKGEFIYARPNDIVLIESCDHLVKVYLAVNHMVKKTIRNNTLKDFLQQLPKQQFMRIGRFCAINLERLSGGNFYEQTLEFDFHVSIKLKHSISLAVFNTIGK